MMKRFAGNNLALLLLIMIITIDASRIFYLPLPKIHPSHRQLKSAPIAQQLHEEKFINNKFRSLSAMERKMHEEDEKRDIVDWETLFDEEALAQRRVNDNDLPSVNEEEFNYASTLNRETREPDQIVKLTHGKTNEVVNRFSQSDGNHDDKEPWVVDTATGRLARLQSDDVLDDSERRKRRNDTLFLVIVGACSLVGVLGLVAAAIFWYKIQKRAEAAVDAEYPSYGVTGPGSNGSKISPNSTVSDRKLAQSAQMFHYQQQRQQMMAQEKAHLDAKPVHSDDSDDEAPPGGDYTVYECAGLATTGEMEVRNPLFAESDSSLTTTSPSVSQPTTNNHYPQLSSTSPIQEKSSSST